MCVRPRYVRQNRFGVIEWIAIASGDYCSGCGRQCTGVRNALTNEVSMGINVHSIGLNSTNTTAAWLMANSLDLGKDRESSPTAGHSYRFGQFVLDSRKRTLSRVDSPVSLTPKAFDVLLFLLQNPNRLVTKEELLQAVWGDTFVEEGNLTQYISHLRKALNDNSEDARLIVTIARKGYQFTPDVTVAEAADIAKHAALQAAATKTSKTDARPVEFPTREKATKSPAPRLRWRKWFAGTALLTFFAAAFWLYSSYGHRLTLSATDTIVIAGVKNETSDPVFDDALDTALRHEMEQTPYLNILGIDKVSGTLPQLNLPPTTKLTTDVARQICGQTNSKMLISQSISDAGNGYRLQMRALDCGSGATLAKEQVDIGKRNEVIHQLGVTAGRLRAKLGEPADTLARFNQPLEKALSSSLEALQAGAQGHKFWLAGDAAGALKLYQRAVELDPNLAVTYGRMGAAYLFLGNTELSAASYTRAYQLRDRLTEKERLNTEIAYYGRVTGDWEKEYSSVLRFLEIFPRDVLAHANLRAAFVHLGQPDRAADEAAETARLQPSAYYFGSAIQSIRFASRFNEAKSWLAKADDLKLDNSLIRRERLIVAFAIGDGDNVEKILKEEERGSYREDFLHEHSLIEIQQGRFHSAERLRLQALRPSTSKASNADWWVVLSALEDAEVGKDAQARRYESKAAGSLLDRNNKIALALALAQSGQTEEAGRLADQISAERPEDTLVQHYFIPTIRAAIKLRQHDPAAAVDLLRGTAKYDLAFTGSFESVYPAYIRGLAYLELGDGPSAAAQFQKLIDNPGFSVRHVIGPLAWLQLGRAQKMMGDEAATRKSYATFLDLWKNADPDVPIYQQAKAEYAKFRK
jgi:eukaryotic-like serine/threonine-protein kinase